MSWYIVASGTTPVVWLAGRPLAAELFATMLDSFLVMGNIAEDPTDRNTADGHPATKPFAHARLARMLGSDGDICSEDETLALARGSAECLLRELSDAIYIITATMLSAVPKAFIIAGSGEFFARHVVQVERLARRSAVISLSERLGSAVSHAACAIRHRRPRVRARTCRMKSSSKSVAAYRNCPISVRGCEHGWTANRHGKLCSFPAAAPRLILFAKLKRMNRWMTRHATGSARRDCGTPLICCEEVWWKLS